MEVYLIRHPRPNIEKGICYGQTDIGLNDQVLEGEFRAIREKIPRAIDQLYTSPLARCKTIALKLNSDFEVDERLKELNFGDWENRKWDAIDPGSLNRWMGDFVNVRTPHGENYLDLQHRTLRFIEEVLGLRYQKIAILTHAGNIRSILSFVLELPLESSFRIHLDYGALVSVVIDENEYLNKLISLQN